MVKYFFIRQCAILLALFEGIVCPVQYLDFIVENFSIADIYDEVTVVDGDGEIGQFILKKGNGSRPRVVKFSEIKLHTIHQEENDPTVVSFFVMRAYHFNYNLKFKQEWQARQYASSKSLPHGSEVAWARVYSNWRPVIIAYDHLNKDDLGFKFLKNENYGSLSECLHRLPFVFKRSEIDEAIRTTPPQTLYLRNKVRATDYEISFASLDDMNTFLELFPNGSMNEEKTNSYYFMP